MEQTVQGLNTAMTVNLPSKGIPYKSLGNSLVMVKKMTGADEELMAEMNAANVKTKLVTLFNRLVAGVPAEKLTVGDESYILLWLAINCYTRTFRIPRLVCENC